MGIEIPLDVVSDIPEKLDTSTSYVGNKYNALPWKEFIEIKLDARNLIEAVVKSALTDLDWFGKIHALYAGKQTEAEMHIAQNDWCSEARKVPDDGMMAFAIWLH